MVHDALESIQIKTNRNQDFLQVNDKEKHTLTDTKNDSL
jgi:hypothetical protein